MNLGDLLDRIADFEQQLDRYLLLARDKSKDNSARLVTYCLALHRRHQECVMGGLKPKALLAARTAQIKSAPASMHAKRLTIPTTAPDDITGKELIEAAISYNNELLSICRAVLSDRVSKEVCAVLKACAGVKERDIVMLKKMQGMKYF
ncbi:MAG: hypothetical protein WCN95_06375 [bacterium]